jgi:hypothetical protein
VAILIEVLAYEGRLEETEELVAKSMESCKGLEPEHPVTLALKESLAALYLHEALQEEMEQGSTNLLQINQRKFGLEAEGY